MKIFIFIVFIIIIFATGNLYNWIVRKTFDEMENFAIVPLLIITFLLALLCGALSEALVNWEIVSFNFN
jgi:hypothetical protein